jgi:hypothetical protein
MRATRWSIPVATVALLMTLGPMPTAAGGGHPLASPRRLLRASPPAIYTGWVMIDVVRTWSAPSPAARLVENDMHFFIRRFQSRLVVNLGSGSSPPNFVTVGSPFFQFYAWFHQRIEPSSDMPDMCRGYNVYLIGQGTSSGSSCGASGSNIQWGIPGIRFTPAGTTPDITFLGGDCEPGRGPLQESSRTAPQAEMAIPGDVQWQFTEDLRSPRSSAAPTSIEGSCDAPLYAASGGRIQCQWQVRAGAAQLVPPRRR